MGREAPRGWALVGRPSTIALGVVGSAVVGSGVAGEEGRGVTGSSRASRRPGGDTRQAPGPRWHHVEMRWIVIGNGTPTR